MKIKLVSASVFSLGCIFALSAQAAEPRTTQSTFPAPTPVEFRTEYKPHVGLLAGVATGEGRYDSAADVGVDVGYQPYVPFGLGAQLTFANHNNSGQGDNIDRTLLLARGTYNFGGSNSFVRMSYVGIGLGVAFENGNTDLVSAPIVGFDYPLKKTSYDFLSVGAQAKYLAVADSSDSFTVDGIVKYWY